MVMKILINTLQQSNPLRLQLFVAKQDKLSHRISRRDEYKGVG